MELEVYWTQFAQDKLSEIYDYYEITASSRIARNLVTGIIDQTINLGKNPNIGQKEELLKNRPEEFRYLVYKNYKIIYWINTIKNRIDIISVFDTRQNPEKIEKTG
jgi:plasmid stabilization system protein ParE